MSDVTASKFEHRTSRSKDERVITRSTGWMKESPLLIFYLFQFSKIKARSDHLSRGPDDLMRLPSKSAMKPITSRGKDDVSLLLTSIMTTNV